MFDVHLLVGDVARGAAGAQDSAALSSAALGLGGDVASDRVSELGALVLQGAVERADVGRGVGGAGEEVGEGFEGDERGEGRGREEEGGEDG